MHLCCLVLPKKCSFFFWRLGGGGGLGRIGLGSGSHWVGEWIARSEREIDMHRKKRKQSKISCLSIQSSLGGLSGLFSFGNLIWMGGG